MRDTRALASTPEVAEFLGIPVRTIDQWAYKGTGPTFSRLGRYRRYRWSDVEAWVDERSKASA